MGAAVEGKEELLPQEGKKGVIESMRGLSEKQSTVLPLFAVSAAMFERWPVRVRAMGAAGRGGGMWAHQAVGTASAKALRCEIIRIVKNTMEANATKYRKQRGERTPSQLREPVATLNNR